MAPAAPAPRRFLPREGFHADVLNRIIAQTIFNPILVLPLLAASRLTEKGRELAISHTTLSKSLAACSAIGLWRWINQWLSRRAVNNGQSDKYDWNREIVLVTGGSDGCAQ